MAYKVSSNLITRCKNKDTRTPSILNTKVHDDNKYTDFDKIKGELQNDQFKGNTAVYDTGEINDFCSEHSSDTDQSTGWFPPPPEDFEDLGVSAKISIKKPKKKPNTNYYRHAPDTVA